MFENFLTLCMTGLTVQKYLKSLTFFAVFLFLNIREAATGGALLKSVLKNFAKFKEKHLCHSLFFAGLRNLFTEHLWTTASDI